MGRFGSLCAFGVAVGIVLSLACQSADPTPSLAVAGASDETPIQGSVAVLSVYGMSCPLCANNIDKQLKKLGGVTKVTVDIGAGSVNVELAGEKKPTPKQLADAIHNSGFSLKNIEIKR